MPSKVLDLDLARQPGDITGLGAYDRAFLLLRWHGRPIGSLWLEVVDGRLAAADLWHAAHARHGHAITRGMAADALACPIDVDTGAGASPSTTVAVCTRDRPDDLRRCLTALCALTPPADEIIIVDNAPSDDRTLDVCRGFPVRYIREDVKGLNWARTRAALESRGEIVAYTDDDATPDPRWLGALLTPFRHPAVAAVTGLVMPLELETEGQERFEQYCGFSRGFKRRVFDASRMSPLGAANAGAGAAMAIRRKLVNELGLFAVELDAGTAAQSGGDSYAFYRLLSLGHRIVYTPAAIAWHRHRRDAHDLVQVLRGYSVGTYVFLLRCLLLHGETGAIRVGLGWFLGHHVRQLLRRVVGRGNAQPLRLTLVEIHGVLLAPWALWKTLRRERANLRSGTTTATRVSEA
jgi:glycosyltransferase involved in cell wall biosynthesis